MFVIIEIETYFTCSTYCPARDVMGTFSFPINSRIELLEHNRLVFIVLEVQIMLSCISYFFLLKTVCPMSTNLSLYVPPSSNTTTITTTTAIVNVYLTCFKCIVAYSVLFKFSSF